MLLKKDMSVVFVNNPRPTLVTLCIVRWNNATNTYWQTRHNFVGEIRIFLVKICINPYPSFLCIDVSRKRSYRDAVCKKNRDIL